MDLKKTFNYSIGEKQDDEVFIDGLPYCKKCGGARFVELGDGEDSIIQRCACKCMAESWESVKLEHEAQANIEKFRDTQKMSMLGERYYEARFDTAKTNKNNYKAFEVAKKYVADAEEMKRLDIGMYIYGKNGTGKTYLTACMCNELIAKGYRCIYTSIQNIMTQIKETYNGGTFSESVLIQILSSADFLFIDDLAKEFLKKQFQGSFAENVMYQVINSRYNNKKPTIFTSNFSITELMEVGLDNAINSRLWSMADITIELQGDDLRLETDLEKEKIIKNILK